MSIVPRTDVQILIDDVKAIRRQVGEGGAGLDIKVTGPAGFSADAVDVFTNIDTKLLLATTTLVVARAAAMRTTGIASVSPVRVGAGVARLDVTLASPPYGNAAFDTISRLRDNLRSAVSSAALTGGPSAQELDTRLASIHDAKFIVPLVLLTVLIILAVLLRAIVAPLVLVATVIVSFAAALGVGVVAFDRLFGFAGIDPSLPVLASVFLVAPGIDYNIFLMARVREESECIGTHRGMLTGLTVTGGVITSAGIVLAGTFSILGILPLVALTEIGFIVAFGVLLDTFVVRSISVPALALSIGPRIWWPSALSREESQSPTATHSADVAGMASR